MDNVNLNERLKAIPAKKIKEDAELKEFYLILREIFEPKNREPPNGGKEVPL